MSGVPDVDWDATDVGDDDADDETASLLDLWEADELDDEPRPEDGDFWIESDGYGD